MFLPQACIVAANVWRATVRTICVGSFHPCHDCIMIRWIIINGAQRPLTLSNSGWSDLKNMACGKNRRRHPPTSPPPRSHLKVCIATYETTPSFIPVTYTYTLVSVSLISDPPCALPCWFLLSSRMWFSGSYKSCPSKANCPNCILSHERANPICVHYEIYDMF